MLWAFWALKAKVGGKAQGAIFRGSLGGTFLESALWMPDKKTEGCTQQILWEICLSAVGKEGHLEKDGIYGSVTDTRLETPS